MRPAHPARRARRGWALPRPERGAQRLWGPRARRWARLSRPGQHRRPLARSAGPPQPQQSGLRTSKVQALAPPTCTPAMKCGRYASQVITPPARPPASCAAGRQAMGGLDDDRSCRRDAWTLPLSNAELNWHRGLPCGAATLRAMRGLFLQRQLQLLAGRR
jgi:hypothetical protein